MKLKILILVPIIFFTQSAIASSLTSGINIDKVIINHNMKIKRLNNKYKSLVNEIEQIKEIQASNISSTSSINIDKVIINHNSKIKKLNQKYKSLLNEIDQLREHQKVDDKKVKELFRLLDANQTIAIEMETKFNTLLKVLNVDGDLIDKSSTFIRMPVDEDVSNEDVEEAMSSKARTEGIRVVGKLPISDMVELQTGEPQRYLKIFQYMSPRTAMFLTENHPELSHLMPLRISLIEDKEGKRWLYRTNLYHYYKDTSKLPPAYFEKVEEVVRSLKVIMKAGAEGD